MKQLIVESIKVKGGNKGPFAITIFNMVEDSQKNLNKYYDISKLCGKISQMEYSYTEEDTTKTDQISIQVPSGMSELEVKDLIILEIQNKIDQV